MNRREALRSLGGGAALGLSAGVIVATTSCVPTEAPATERSIASMFDEWMGLHDRDSTNHTAEEDEAFHARYRELQDAIIRAEPKTPRDLAMMAYADNDGGVSEFSEEFDARLLAMALQGRTA